MDKIVQIINRKPVFFVAIALIYIALVGFLKWWTAPPWESLWFVGGGMLGIYFLDIAEVFFALSPSPFRSIVFAAAFALVSFFVVTSSGSLLASGLVLSLYLALVLAAIGEWQVRGNLTSWYQMIEGPVDQNIQRWGMVLFVVLFIVETYLFIR
ncbi:MAG: hypothetical protein UY16_C0029G0017 [Candidatus Gottesmanbacteria bacterium GW2011_GWA2_47_9]|uniref:Uncharacterized protein n=1 Tax=Candidatus Gottesmanbacteria bacterium GW2011_GWA2_47_9 TaxID=1618445 RepID=A0A0G1WAL3_9BACT|nr:MAG: hypothetical protein UY16_C0029G0017 [Candidatus Gottesmanbacteria bacterium GW2011_GWA2_47_9]